MRNRAFVEALNDTLNRAHMAALDRLNDSRHRNAPGLPVENVDVRTGHITLVAQRPGETRTYTHTSPATGSALLRRLDCDFLKSLNGCEPYAVRFRTHDSESSVVLLAPNQVMPLSVPEEPETDWANALTDTLVENINNGTRSYFSHVPREGFIALFKGGCTSRTAKGYGSQATFHTRASEYRISKED